MQKEEYGTTEDGKKVKITEVHRNPPPTKVEISGELIDHPYFAEFKDKQFARNFLLSKGDLKKSFELTFGFKGTPREMDTMLNRPLVQREIDKLLPSEMEIKRILAEAFAAKTPGIMKWGDKHKFLETVLIMKGHLKKDDDKKTQVNIAMVIDREKDNPATARIIAESDDYAAEDVAESAEYDDESSV